MPLLIVLYLFLVLRTFNFNAFTNSFLSFSARVANARE